MSPNDVRDGNSNGAARKALLQTLIAEVRVESRDAITPSFRVPLQTPVRHCVRIGREDSPVFELRNDEERASAQSPLRCPEGRFGSLAESKPY